MFRQYDFRCKLCHVVHVDLIDVPYKEMPAPSYALECPYCETGTIHERLLSAPSPYMGEKNLNVVMHGGRFDTAGKRELPELPDAPGEKEAREASSKKLAELPANASKGAMESALATVDVPSSKDFMAHFDSPAYKKIENERKLVKRENAAKKKRLEALRRGEVVNMRRDKCRGDPKIT